MLESTLLAELLEGYRFETTKPFSVGFIEVGCKPGGKRRQLRDRTDRFNRHWELAHRPRYQWRPRVYRLLAHFDQKSNVVTTKKPWRIDTALSYDTITEEHLERLTLGEITDLKESVPGGSAIRKEITRHLKEKNAKALHEIVAYGGEIPKTGYFRGLLAELVVQQDIGRCAPETMRVTYNTWLDWNNPPEPEVVETDGLFFFTQQEEYRQLVGNLRKLNHLKVKDSNRRRL